MKTKSKKKNTQKMPTFLIITTIIFFIVLLILYFLLTYFSADQVIPYSGYAVADKEITQTLINSENLDKAENVKAVKVEEQEQVFKRLNKYYIGIEEKQEINLEYPIYINNKIALYNLTEDLLLINEEYNQIEGYPRITITDGSIYNPEDLEKMDQMEYLFAKNDDGIFINLKEFNIKTELNEYIIPINSLLYFRENYIAYYSIEQEEFKYKKIEDIDASSEVDINSQKDTYSELLRKLGILKEQEEIEDEPIENTEETNSEQVEVNQTVNENTQETENNQVDNNTQIDNEENNNENNNDSEDNKQEVPYIKPEVNANQFDANVYSATTSITINDPQKRIKNGVTFIVKKGNKICLRKTAYATGQVILTGLEPNSQYQIEASYIYVNKEEKKIQNDFFSQEITTKGLNTLESIKLEFENGEIYSNKIEIKNLKIVSDLNSESLRGVQIAEIVVNNSTYAISKDNWKKMLKGEAVTVQTSGALPSNTVINYEIKLIDSFGNELKLENYKGTTRTSKIEPSAVIKIDKKEQSVYETIVRLTLNNKDNVELNNYRYILADKNNIIEKEENLSESDTKLTFNDLDPDRTYVISLVADYDLIDGKGKRENQIIGEATFNTISLDSLGALNLLGEVVKVGRNEAEITVQINDVGTDHRLVNVLEEIKITIYNEEKNSYFEKIFTGEEIEDLKQYDIKTITFNELLSNTKYLVKAEGKVKQGNVEQNIKETNCSLTEFQTDKEPAKVLVQNKFITESKIYFDTKIVDTDLSILEDYVRLELRNNLNQLVKIKTITKNIDFIEISFDKLKENTEYTIQFIAQNYNEGSKDATRKSNYELDSFSFIIEKGISGKLQLLNLTRNATGKNLVDITSKTKWYSVNMGNVYNYYSRLVYEDKGERILRLLAGASSYTQYYTYKLPDELIGKTVTMTFDAKFDKNGQMSEVYVVNSKNNSAVASRLTPKGLTNANLSATLNTEEWKKVEVTCTLNNTGYIGLYLKATAAANPQNLLIKNLQIEEGSNVSQEKEFTYTTEAEININVEDVKQETDKYFIDIYKDGNFTKREEYEIAKFGSQTRFYTVDNNSTYEFKLVIVKENKEYVISTTSFNTKEEIKGIRTPQEFADVTADGNYVILDDLDFTGNYRSGDSKLIGSVNYGFKGTLDFQGHTVKLDNKNSRRGIFYLVEETGVIKNMVLDIYLNNPSEQDWCRGLAEINRGTITNLQINLKECTNVPRISTCLIGDSNYGTLSNFVINLEVPFYGARGITAGFYNCYGTIKNGYVYGENIVCTDNGISNGQERAPGVVTITVQKGFVENVYSLVSVDGNARSGVTNQVYDSTGNVIYNNNGGNVKNIYSVGAGTLTRAKLNYGPTIGNNSGNVTNAYYFVDDIDGKKYVFNNTYNERISKYSIIDEVFQNNVLNSENQFLIEDYVDKGYYPQVVMDECMPQQKYIELPELLEEDKVDILALKLIEDFTEENNGMKIEMSVRNKTGAKITDIKIQDLDTKVESSTFVEESSISNVIVLLSNPKQYKSMYQVNSISWKGTYGGNSTRTYNANERLLAIDFYKPVYTIEDWKNINNSLSENYRLMADLDFKGKPEADILIKNTYRGKLDGGNHTIKNITSSKGIIYTLEGELKNLNIYNYTQEMSENYAGIIRSANVKTIIDNVHVDTVNITNQVERDASDIGGLVGYIANATIKNSSVKNVTISINGKISTIRLGGMVGRADNVKISNSFVENANITVTNVLKSEGIGGIIGRETQNGAYVRYCYVTGNIKTNSEYVGGIYGFTSGNVQYNYSLINLESETDFLGGIGGYDNNSSDSSTYGNLSLGQIFSTKDSKNIQRIIGNTYIEKGNYAYIDQIVNGAVIQDVLGAEALLTSSNLKNPDIYIDTLNWQNQFDYSELEQGILPKIYNTNGQELVKEQSDNLLQEVDVSIKDIYVPDEHDVDSATITISINNLQKYEITEIIFGDEDDEELIKEKLRVQNNEDDSSTEMQYKVSPKRAYDCYTVTAIKYKDNNGIERTQKVKVTFDVQFYHKIANSQEWINKVKQDTEENYILTGDIIFTNEQTESIAMNYKIGRLEGNGKKVSFNEQLNSIGKTINGKEQGFIKNLKHSMSNITFENITINNTGSSNYTGLIVRNTADLENCKFNNIKINANNMNYVGIIANNSAIEISNITLDNITISGKSYTSAFLAYTDSGSFNNITANHINITSRGNYAGGIVAYVVTRSPDDLQKFYGNDINIDSTGDYVGGLIAYGQLSSSNITSSNIRGRHYIGGIAGRLINSSNGKRYYHVTGCTINSTGNYSGGVAGYIDSYVYYCVVEDCTINASGYAGGITGFIASEVRYTATINCNIIATGDYIGGVFGRMHAWACYNNFAKGCTVKGRNIVGGFAGYMSYGNMGYNYNDSIITATGNYVGGIIGYLENTDMTNANSPSTVRCNYSVNKSITGKSYVGGMIGYVSSSLYLSSSHYFNNLSVANITGTDSATVYSVVGGSKNTETLNGINKEFLQNKNYVYEGNTINGKQIATSDYSYKDNNGNNVSRTFTLNQLLQQSTYTSTLGWGTGEYTYVSNKYPMVPQSKVGGYFEKGSATETKAKQEGIDIPGIAANSTIRNLSLGQKMQLNSIKILPQISIYTIDVDKINIEFSSTDSNNYFYYEINGEKSEKIPVNQKVYTMKYDFKTPINVSITNGVNTKTITINPDDVANHITFIGDDYYYLEEMQIKNTNGKEIKGRFVNLYGNKALRVDGEIYDIENKSTNQNTIEVMKIQEYTIPLEEATYSEKTIETYAKFSIIKQDENKIERNGQIWIRNNKLGIIDYSISKVPNGQIIDSYNQNEYQTILGTDGKLYDLKANLHYPNGFKNQNIKEILDDKKNNVIIYYNTGRVYIFNYVTGKLIYDNNKTDSISLFSYIKENLSSDAIEEDIAEIMPSAYKSSKDIIEYLKVAQANNKENTQNNKENNLNNQNDKEDNQNNKENHINNNESGKDNTSNYITTYDNVSKTYLIYNEDDLLDTKVQEVASETYKLQSQYELYSKYEKQMSPNSKAFNINGAIIVISIICVVIVILIFLRKRRNS